MNAVRKFRAEMNTIADSETQLSAVDRFFEGLAARMDRLPVASAAGMEELIENDA